MMLSNVIGKGAQATVYRTDDYAIKLFKIDYNRANVFYEALITFLVENTKLPIAKTYEILNINNQLAIKMDYIKGISLHDCFINGKENAETYVEKMVQIQLEIHSKNVQLPFDLKDRLKEKIQQNQSISGITKGKLLSRLIELPEGDSLCHGDFHGYNIIIDENQYYIIDWIDATNGCPNGDACRTYMLYAFHSLELADLYLNCYCKMTGEDKNEVLEWLPVVAAARLCENNQNEIEKLLEWIENIS